MSQKISLIQDEINRIIAKHWPAEHKNFSPLPFEESETKRRLLVFEAQRWVGIQESGGNNEGQMIERFQKSVDNRAHGEAWCMSFVQFCIEAVDGMFSHCFSDYGCNESQIYKSEHVLTTFNNSRRLQIEKPEPGALICWQMFKNDQPTSSGHTGIIVDVIDDEFVLTVEGNTSNPSSEVEREGDGVFLKKRRLVTSGKMRVKGFLRPW